MMRTYVLIFGIVFFLNSTGAAQDTLLIRHTTFIVERYDRPSEEYTGQDTLIRLYRLENGAKKYLLSHVIYQQTADCNSVFTDYGRYEVRGDSLIFFTDYTFDSSSNFGLPLSRVQAFLVTDNGRLIEVYDRELTDDGVWVDSGE